MSADLVFRCSGAKPVPKETIEEITCGIGWFMSIIKID